MTEFFTQPISRREGLIQIGTLISVRPVVRAAVALGTTIVLSHELPGLLPSNPSTAMAETVGERFNYNGNQERVRYADVDGEWIIYGNSHKPWPLSDGNYGPMTEQTVAKWGIKPYHAKGAVGEKFDLAMARMGKPTKLQQLLGDLFSMTTRLAKEQNFPASCYESFGMCHGWAAASAAMRDVLPENTVAGVSFSRGELRHLLTASFASVKENPIDHQEFVKGVPVVAAIETCDGFPKFYGPKYGQRTDGKSVSVGQIRYVAWETENMPSSRLSSVFTPDHIEAVGSNINPRTNNNHGWSIHSEAPMSTILKFAYEPKPQF